MYLERFFEGDASMLGCLRCRATDRDFDLELRMAFQPIADVARREVYAYEALVRGANGEGAGWVLDQVTPETLYQFDQTCRVLAIGTAAQLGMKARLSINFIPNAVYQPAACLRVTLAAAKQADFPVDRLIFELTESERIVDPAHALSILAYYHQQGFATAIDDFGAGFAGLGLLARFQPQILKIDMELVRDIGHHRPKQVIVESVLRMAREFGSRVIAEGVETVEEFRWLRGHGVELFQGYLIGRPALGELREPDWAAIGA